MIHLCLGDSDQRGRQDPVHPAGEDADRGGGVQRPRVVQCGEAAGREVWIRLLPQRSPLSCNYRNIHTVDRYINACRYIVVRVYIHTYIDAFLH